MPAVESGSRSDKRPRSMMVLAPHRWGMLVEASGSQPPAICVVNPSVTTPPKTQAWILALKARSLPLLVLCPFLEICVVILGLIQGFRSRSDLFDGLEGRVTP